jgi:hypothetical protein
MKFGSPPAGSGIQLAEASESRVVMVIPPGGKRARGMGFFALVWLAITIPAGLIFLYAAISGEVEWEGDDPPPIWAIVLFFSIFWSVGFVMGYVALKMKFESLMLCLEPGRLSIQRSMFGRRKMSTIQLQEHSEAVLRTSYSENDVPVYRIEIEGAARKQKFGTALQLVEKQWIVQTINRFLGHGLDDEDNFHHGGDQFCAECGTQLLVSEERRVCPDCGAVFYEDEDGKPGDRCRSKSGSGPGRRGSGGHPDEFGTRRRTGFWRAARRQLSAQPKSAGENSGWWILHGVRSGLDGNLRFHGVVGRDGSGGGQRDGCSLRRDFLLFRLRAAARRDGRRLRPGPRRSRSTMAL